MVLQVIFIDPRFATAASIIRYGNLMLAQAAMETLRKVKGVLTEHSLGIFSLTYD